MNLRSKIPNYFFDYKRTSDILPKKGFFFDTHSHTIASDDGWMTSEQCVRWHISNGYNGFVLSDHNTSANNKAILALQDKYPNILIVPGFEWTTVRIHLNFLGVENFSDEVPWVPTDDDIEKVIKKVKDMKGVVQVDHIPWTMNQVSHLRKEHTHPTREQLVEWGVDGFEINNEMRWYDSKTIHWLEKLKEEGKLPRPIFLSTGTDIHNPMKEWASGWTEILLIEEETVNPDWTVIKKALLEARTKIWVDHDPFIPYEAEQYKLLRKGKKK